MLPVCVHGLGLQAVHAYMRRAITDECGVRCRPTPECYYKLMKYTSLMVMLDMLFHCCGSALQVSFDAEGAVPLSTQAVAQLRHVLFACNASIATFTEAWRNLQDSPVL